MPRSSPPSDTVFARIRSYYGFTLRELAIYLGISETLVHHYETGRRIPSLKVAERLAPLLDQLREGAADVPLPFGPPAGQLDPAPLEARRVACLHQAGSLRQELRLLPAQARQAARWARALPTLQASVPLASPPPFDADPATKAETIRQTHVRDWLALQPTALSPEDLSRWHLLLVRAQALEAEAAALSALLG